MPRRRPVAQRGRGSLDAGLLHFLATGCVGLNNASIDPLRTWQISNDVAALQGLWSDHHHAITAAAGRAVPWIARKLAARPGQDCGEFIDCRAHASRLAAQAVARTTSTNGGRP